VMSGLSRFYDIAWGYRLRDQKLSNIIVMPQRMGHVQG